MMRGIVLAVMLLGVAMLTGCAQKQVKAWERGYLALPEMASSYDATAKAYRDHLYFSKEAANGGAAVGGGGCGCN